MDLTPIIFVAVIGWFVWAYLVAPKRKSTNFNVDNNRNREIRERIYISEDVNKKDRY